MPRKERAVLIQAESGTLAGEREIGQQTSSALNEILAFRPVNLDIALTNVVFVSFQRQFSVLDALKTNQGFSVAPALLAQTQRDASPSVRRAGSRLLIKLIFKGPG